jgi:hypothetical protein
LVARIWKLVAGLGAGLALSASAQALTLEPDAIAFDIADDGTRAGVVEFLGTSIGVPPGGLVLDGAIDPLQDVYVFQLTAALTSNAFDSVLIAAVSSSGTEQHTPDGGGTVPGSWVPVDSIAPAGANTLEYFFGVGLGARSDQFFIAFANLQETDLVRFGFRRTGGAVDFLNESFVAVPEPASGALLLLGLAGTAARKRRALTR